MSDDRRDAENNAQPSEVEQPQPEDPSRREFIAGTVPTIALGALVSVGLVLVSDEGEAADGKRKLNLLIRVPQNIEVAVQTERVPTKALALEAAPSQDHEVRHAVIDLTTARAETWLRPGTKRPFDGTACCVRG